MTTQSEKAQTFADLHSKGNPLILVNIWDAGTAQALQQQGTQAIATSSYAVAKAHGYDDGEQLSFDLVLANLRRIIAVTDLPVTMDIEGGYSREIDGLQANIAQVISAGAVGINVEDQIIGGNGLHTIEEQVERISAIREIADNAYMPLFINARTDVFFQHRPQDHSIAHLEEVIERTAAYAQAGASGIFVPGLKDPDLIEKLCDAVSLPVNIMFTPNTSTPAQLSALGVSRISYGHHPYVAMLVQLSATLNP